MRKFYGFNSLESVVEHISKIKTLQDVHQLEYDIYMSGTVRTKFKKGVPGVYGIDHATENCFRHIFITKEALGRLGEIRPDEADSYTVLEDEQ